MTKKVKILSDIPGYTTGQTVTVKTDKQGTPLERFWRRRFVDAKTEIISDTKPNLKPKQEKAK